jgi:hypothetical protein
VSPRVREDSLHPRLQSGASGRPLNFTVRRLVKAFARLTVAIPIRLLWGIAAFAVVSSLSGCCLSYGRIAAVDRNGIGKRPDVAGLVVVVENAVSPLGFRASVVPTYNSRWTAYSVVDGRNGLNVMIDNETLSMKLTWGRPADAAFASRVQNAIERGFLASYGTNLQFKDVPCGWLGP